MSINKFITNLDLSRQAEILSGETAVFQGGIELGIPFSGFPSGVDTSTIVSLGIVGAEFAAFSGNTGTTIFNVTDPSSPYYSVSATTLSASPYTIIDSASITETVSATTYPTIMTFTALSGDCCSTPISVSFTPPIIQELYDRGLYDGLFNGLGQATIGTTYIDESFYNVGSVFSGANLDMEIVEYGTHGTTPAWVTGTTSGTVIEYSALTQYWTDPIYENLTSGLTLPITPESADTQTSDYVWTLTNSTIIDENLVGLQYTGYSVTYSFDNVIIDPESPSITGGVTGATSADTYYLGTVTATLENYSAGTLDYKGSTNWLIVNGSATIDERLTTDRLTIHTLGTGSPVTMLAVDINGNVVGGTGGTTDDTGAFTSTTATNTIIPTNTAGNSNDTDYASILAGQNNTISGTSTSSAIVGGENNKLSGSSTSSVIAGGQFNTVGGSIYSGIFGGSGNVANGSVSESSVIVAGESNTATDARFGAIVGGTLNTMDNNFRSVIIGGLNNTNNSDQGAIIAGDDNTIDTTSNKSAIIAGEENDITSSSSFSVIAGGWYNTFNTNSTEGFIGGGSGNTIDNGSDRSGMLGGKGLLIDGSENSIISGGEGNSMVDSDYSAIIGGSGNTNTHDRSVILGGLGITTTANDTAYVSNLNIGTLGGGASVNNLGIDSSGNVVVGSAGGITGTGVSNQVTYWDSTSSITSDTGFTWDGSTMKITKNSAVGGIIIDTSGDPSPASFSDKYQAAFILTESSNDDYDPTDLNSTLNTLSIGTVGAGFQTQGKIGPGIAFTFTDDNGTGGANAVIRMVKSDTDIFGQPEDGSLLVLGTRDADNGGGGADVKESIRIGHNQYVGINYTPDNSTNPGAMLTLGTNASDETTIAMRETSTTTTNITGYGQFYVKSSDSKPYFKTSSGTEYDLTTGTGGVTIDPYNDLGNVGTTQTWDVSGTSTNYELTLTGGITLNLNNVRNGDYGTIIVEQDGVGSHTLTFGTINGVAGTHKVVNGGGGSPTLTSTPNAIDILSFTYNGTTMYWTVGNDYT